MITKMAEVPIDVLVVYDGVIAEQLTIDSEI